MKETKKSTVYQTPKVTVVNFTVEGGFGHSVGDADNMGTQAYEEIEVDNTNTTTGWGSGVYI
jgi:hypothetical protein